MEPKTNSDKDFFGATQIGHRQHPEPRRLSLWRMIGTAWTRSLISLMPHMSKATPESGRPAQVMIATQCAVCAVGVQLGCSWGVFFLKMLRPMAARWTREPLWNRLAIWTSLPETSAGCQCTAKFLCRKSMDISITGTKRLPGVGRMCFKCSVLVKWVAKAASKNHRKENQRIQALTSSARQFLPYGFVWIFLYP